ncbi:MAG: hypothetical protein IJ591_09100, partial [Lachnospiraceae bacterium]|nr:hypothetical protein [Lachnospiraceae bacterium]
MNRRYYKFTIHLESPLSLGSGINENSDHDIIRDSRGLPMIPATSIAGVISSDIISDIADEELKKELKNRLFGCIDGKKSSASSVVFYDAVCVSKDPVITIRDSVGLKEDAKVATTGAKFDFEIVETGCDFETFIELDDNVSDDDEDVIKKQLAKLHHGILRFGHKTTRGYGQVSIKGLK